MINSLEINNIALISHLCLNFDKGLTVLSGETGSGKSIIVDALSFVLGERADKSLIKHGTDKASVEVSFNIVTGSKTWNMLEELGIDTDNIVIISRVMTTSGKNECRVNGKICSASMLKAVSSTLVDIFGQSQHLNLLKVDKHIDVIDGFANFGNTRVQLTELYTQYKLLKKQLQEVGGSEAERARQLDILQFQIDELTNANLSLEEEQQLEQEHIRIVNMEKIVNSLSTVQQCLSDSEPSVLSSFSICSSALKGASKFDEELNALANRLDSARIEVADVADAVNDILSNTNYSSIDVDRVESRLDVIRNIKRKYGGTIEQVLEFLDDAITTHAKLSNASEIFEQLSLQINDITTKMYQISKVVSQQRQDTALTFTARIEEELSYLGMKGAKFYVQFAEMPTLEQYRDSISANGYDKVEFLLSANIGEPLKPLVKVISGGEMSRFMLAIKNITATVENIPTMVFDEIDTGISGKVAEMVANKLNCVSSHYQSIVITHLPQIVAMADNNLVICKVQEGDRTVTKVDVVTELANKAEEVSRLMGGVGVHAINSALEMIERCNKIKLTN